MHPEAAPPDPQQEPRPARPRWLRVARSVLAALVVALCFYYLGRQMIVGLRSVSLRELRPEAWPVLLSLGLTVLCVGLGGWAWGLLLAALGHPLALRRSMGIHTGSNLAKYVPGYAWQLLGKGYLARREGVPAGVVAFALLLEMLALLLTGAGVALSAMPNGSHLPLVGALASNARLALAASAWLLVALLPVVLRGLGHMRWRGRGLPPLVRPGALWAALAVQTLSWALYGLAFGCLVRAFGPLTGADWRLSVYSLAASFLVSLITLFVPAGLGVRESVMTATLGQRLPGSLPVVVALLSRITLMVSEVLAWTLSRAWLWAGRRNASITHKD